MVATESILVSLHLPKTAGTSFGETLRQHFGSSLYEDYGTRPLNEPRWRREFQALCAGTSSVPPCVRAIHGHFLPVKYWLSLRRRDAQFVTWMRDPVERVVSHYYFWLRNPQGATPAQTLRRRVLLENWSLERFCLGPELHNLYSQFLWGFPLRRFDFIGITERYASDLAIFANRFLGSEARVVNARANPNRGEAGYEIAPVLRERIARHHARDMAIYRWACDRMRG